MLVSTSYLRNFGVQVTGILSRASSNGMKSPSYEDTSLSEKYNRTGGNIFYEEIFYGM